MGDITDSEQKWYLIGNIVITDYLLSELKVNNLSKWVIIKLNN